MALTDNQKKELREAIGDAFTQGELEMLFNENTGKINHKNLSNLVSAGDSYDKQVSDLGGWLDRQEKIKDFLEVAKSYNPGNVKLRNFRAYYFTPLSEEQLRNLKEILNSIEDFRLVKQAYFDTLPKGAKTDNPELLSPDLERIIISLLEDYSEDDGVVSILKFANRLKNRVENCQELEEWYEQLPDSIKKLGEAEIVPPSTEQLQICLLMAVFPEGNEFRLEVQLIEDERSGSTPLPWDDEELGEKQEGKPEDRKGFSCESIDKIPAKLQAIINNIQDRFCFQDLLITIEVFLPHQHLAKKLHHEWHFALDYGFTEGEKREEREAIVKNYDFVAHPIERITGRQARIQFQRGWHRLENLPSNPLVVQRLIKPIYCLQQNCSWQELEKELIDQVKELTKKDVEYCKKCLPIGMKLKRACLESMTEEEDFLKTILRGGFPLAFWKRYQAPTHLQEFDRLEERIEPYLEEQNLNYNLKKLIHYLCEIYREPHCISHPPPEHLGYHLGFVCDSLPRMKQIYQLKEPRQKR